jgi:peptidoglycan/LPS O-acetylase OafA/YrhL
MSGLTLGGLLAVLPPKNRETNSAFGILALAFLAFAVSGFRWESPFALLTGGLAVDLGAGCLILSLAAREGSVARMLSLKPLVYLGKLSYSIYLWHFPIALPLRDRFSPMLTFVIVLTAAVAIATVSYEFMEKPLAEWRHRRQQRGTVRFAQT